MLGRRLLAVVTIVSLLAIGHSGSSIGVSANPSAECAQLAWYAGELMAVGERIDADEATGPSTDNMETWTGADYDTAIAEYDSFLAWLNGIDPPPSAVEFHQAITDGVALFQVALGTMKTDGPFALLAYLDQFDQLNRKVAALALPLEERCGLALYDNDSDGEPEVGAGSATPVAGSTEAAGTPVPGAVVPIGTTVQTSDAFSLTIVSVDQDALAAVQDANPGSVPPDGFQFVNLEIKLGHLRDQKDTFTLENLVALGPTGVAYSAVSNSCGPMNGPLSPGEYGGTLTMTGHVCFVIASQDVAGLRLYDASQPAEERVYLSLDPDAE